MKVLHVTPHPDLRNGISEYAGTFARAMRECAGVEMERVAFPEGTYTRREIARALDALDLRQYDLVHGELGAGTNSVYYALAHLSRRPTPPTLVTLHDPPLFLFSPTLDRFGYRTRGVVNKAVRKLVADPLYNAVRLPRVARRLRRYVVLNRGAVEAVRRRVPGAEVHYVPLVGTGRVRDAAPGTPTDVLCYGYLARVKGVELAVRAVAALRDRGLALRLHVVGGTLDPSYERALRAEVTRRRMDPHVVWHGFVADGDLDPVLDACGVALLPYRELGPRGASAAIVRVMEHGLPVVVSDVPRFTGEYHSGEDVQTFRSGDASDLAERLRAVVTDAALRARLAAAARRRVATQHAPGAVAARVRALYEAAAGAR